MLGRIRQRMWQGRSVRAHRLPRSSSQGYTTEPPSDARSRVDRVINRRKPSVFIVA